MEKNLNKKYITIWAIVLGMTFLLILYAMGMLYGINISNGFYINPIKYLPSAMIARIIPHIIIVIISELIRTLVCKKNNKSLTIGITLALIMIDIAINIRIYSYSSIEGIFEMIGCLFIPSICSNLLFNYMAKRFGSTFNIIFRFITVIIYNYFMPIIPDIYPIFESLIELVYPYAVYMIIDYVFSFDNEETVIGD